VPGVGKGFGETIAIVKVVEILELIDTPKDEVRFGGVFADLLAGRAPSLPSRCSMRLFHIILALLKEYEEVEAERIIKDVHGALPHDTSEKGLRNHDYAGLMEMSGKPWPCARWCASSKLMPLEIASRFARDLPGLSLNDCIRYAISIAGGPGSGACVQSTTLAGGCTYRSGPAMHGRQLRLTDRTLGTVAWPAPVGHEQAFATIRYGGIEISYFGGANRRRGIAAIGEFRRLAVPPVATLSIVGRAPRPTLITGNLLPADSPCFCETWGRAIRGGCG
jgi:hypothetical protein